MVFLILARRILSSALGLDGEAEVAAFFFFLLGEEGVEDAIFTISQYILKSYVDIVTHEDHHTSSCTQLHLHECKETIHFHQMFDT